MSILSSLVGTFYLLLLTLRSSAPSGQEPRHLPLPRSHELSPHGTVHPRQIFHEPIYFNTEDNEVMLELASDYLMCMTQRLMYQHGFKKNNNR